MRALFFLFGLILLSTACSSPSKITQKGLSFARLGEPMPTRGTTELEGYPARDTLYDQGGFQWRALILSGRNEKSGEEIFIEEDFAQQGLINRIRIESPGLKVGKNKKVGMSWIDLSALGKNWDAFYLKEYGVWDVIAKSKDRIHYLLEEKRDTATIDFEGGVSSISNDAKVTAIVVM